jgi:hypothetical protein
MDNTLSPIPNPSLIAILTIHHVVTHGKAGSVDGILQLQDGGSVAFCDVYEFTNAKGTAVRAITSYLIERSRGAVSNPV